jgi:3-phosphoglycerate kinase
MDIRKIQDAEVAGKKVILRVGFDVSIENNLIKEKFKIETVKESLDYLMKNGARVALMTWLGRPKGEKDFRFSELQIKDEVENILGYKIKFVADCIGEEVKKAMEELKEGEVAMLENVRFYPGEGDVEMGTEYDAGYAKMLADGFDLFVNDAFSQDHRNQASIAGIPKFIPSCAGFLVQKEIRELDKVQNSFKAPAVAIIGGAKIETKLPVINVLERKYDNILVGGKIANEAIERKIKFSQKVVLPVDFTDGHLDIGPKTIAKFRKIISDARTIIWNGPLGKFEEEKYAVGTNEIFSAIMDAAEGGAFVLVGGGETLEVIEKNNAMKKVGFVSTGGGAMLDYLSGDVMPGIEALKN